MNTATMEGNMEKQDAEWDNETAKRTVKVLFGIPNEGHTLVESYDNRMEMARYHGAVEVASSVGKTSFRGHTFPGEPGIEYQFDMGVVGQTFPAYAREQLGDLALEGAYDYLFMVDDDMITEPHLFFDLYKHGKDIVAALAFTRQPPHKPVIYRLDSGFDSVVRKDYYVNYPVLSYPKNQLVKCDAVGFGAVLIDMRCLRGMKKPWFMSTTGSGEDIWFCHKAGEQGFEVYMDTATKIGHLGNPKIITEETYEAENDVSGLRERMGENGQYS